MECSQPSAWTTNQCLLVASRVKACPKRPTNFCSALPRAEHVERGVAGCHQCITLHSGSAPASLDIRPTPQLSPACIPSTTSIPAPTIVMTNYTHAPTGDKIVRLPQTTVALLRSSSGICGNATTTLKVNHSMLIQVQREGVSLLQLHLHN